MSLSQVQIIRSLAEALTWFERELAWKVEPAELRHLTGRIGELYAAMITRGQMALETNQRGYDVVSADGEHISVKTFTTSTHVSFRKSTFAEVHRVMVLKINVDEGEASIEEVFDGSAADLLAKSREVNGEYQFNLRKTPVSPQQLEDLKITARAFSGAREIIQYENGTIVAVSNGIRDVAALPVLRQVAAEISVSLLNSNGNPRNTRQLGAEIIATLTA